MDSEGGRQVGGKTLLAYISAGGATEEYAQIISDVLRSRGHDVDLVNLKREKAPDLTPYANVVLGTGVRMAMVYRKGKKFLGRSDLAGKSLAVYLSSGIAIEEPGKAREKFLTPLIERNGLAPVMCDALPGKAPGGPGGKLKDTTDADAARKWAEKLADRLGGAG
jgi:menaquinone-dependent protoporphyrinogen IX oxidase